MGARKTMKCEVCGKDCRGKICSECRKRHIREQEVCPVCGGYKGHGAKICVNCHREELRKEREQRLETLKASTPTYKCQYCGKDIPWNPSFAHRVPKYCNAKCAGHAEKKDHPLWHTKEEVIARIHEEIDRTGEYVTREHMNKVLHISDKVLTRLHLSLTDINADKGKYLFEDAHRIRQLFLDGFVGTLSEARELLGISTKGRVPVRELRRLAGTKEDVVVRSKKEVEDMILDYIKSLNRAVTTVEVIRHFHMDHYSALKSNNVSVRELNERAGFKNETGISIYEVRALDILETSGTGAWELGAVFDSLVSPTSGTKLRVDLYSRQLNTVIEIDGPEHDSNSTDPVTVRALLRDKVKNEWASNHGVRLIRIKTMPYDTFDERVKQVADNLVKLGEH